MPAQKLTVTPNVPIQISLRYPDGKQVEGRFADQMYYSLQTPPESCLYLDMDVAAKINMLGPRRGEPFWICKRWTGKKTDSPIWDVWPVGDQEAPPPPPPPPPSAAAQATGIPDSDLEQKLRASLAEIERAKQAGANVSAPAPVVAAPVTAQPPYNNGNGSKPLNGNGARPYEAAGIPSPQVKIPYDVAFRELLQIVVDGLKAAGEQWSDAAKQDAVSTLLIQAARDGFLSCWQRGAK
jgi:hypothetical protein